MTSDKVEEYLLSLPGVFLDTSYPFGQSLAVYKYGDPGVEDSPMLALAKTDSSPLRLSLRCDPQLAEALREEYETVLPGENLSRRNWNTIICSGQLDEETLRDLMRHSYELVKE